MRNMNIAYEVTENGKKLTEKLRLIADNMISTREKSEVEYRPYRKASFVNRDLRREIKFDLGELFGKHNKGDYAYIAVSLLCQKATEASVLMFGAESVSVNGITYLMDETEEFNDKNKLNVYLKEGYNELIFKCVAGDKEFKMEYTVGHVFWPSLWTCDYLLWVRDCIPMEEYIGEQGFAVTELVKCGENKSFEACSIQYPPSSEDDSVIDFMKLYGNESGSYAMSVSYARCDGKFLIMPLGDEAEVYINGKKSDCNVNVKKDDEICVISKRSKDGWGFECKTNDILHLPIVTSQRNKGISWIHIGSFKDGALRKIQFKDTYETADGNLTYWRFTEEDTYLRPYLDTCFYGQWFYGLMVGEYGLLRASRYSDEYYEYFEESMRVLVDYFHYMKYDAEMFGTSTFLKRSVKTHDLDSIGTIGMNLYELYIRTEDAEYKNKIKSVMDNLIENMYTHIPRMSDGTFYRKQTMWADDTYMSCPFLVRMGKLTGETKYFDEAVKQLKLYTQKLYIDEWNVFAHIFWPQEGRNNHVPWGRGNGWVYLSFAEVIEQLPKDYAGRDELIEIFKKAVKGLVKFQDKCGMWHQVLCDESSYHETSCTAIFTIAILKGIKLGILSREEYLPVMKKAVNGLLDYGVDECGNVWGVCRGSGCSDDAQYYASLKTILNDDHGTGVVMAAIAELEEQLI